MRINVECKHLTSVSVELDVDQWRDLDDALLIYYYYFARKYVVCSTYVSS